MKARISRVVPSPAMAVAATALFIALGGSGYAAVALTHSGKVRAAASTLGSGQSESGAFSAADGAAGSGGYLGAGVTFQVPLASPIAHAHIIDTGTHNDTAHCSGPGHAARGYLCLYDRNLYSGVHGGYGYSDQAGYFGHPTPGVILYFPVTGADAYVGGSWTVTAP